MLQGTDVSEADAHLMCLEMQVCVCGGCLWDLERDRLGLDSGATTTEVTLSTLPNLCKSLFLYLKWAYYESGIQEWLTIVSRS